MKKADNEHECLKAEERVLSTLASAESPIGFNQLLEEASISSKTLALHLKTSLANIVQKQYGGYRITDDARQPLEDVKRELESRKKHAGSQSYVEIVEVYFIGPRDSCKGRLAVTSPRKLTLKERGRIEKVITQSIRTFNLVVPKDSGKWRLSIYSQIRSKPTLVNRFTANQFKNQECNIRHAPNPTDTDSI